MVIVHPGCLDWKNASSSASVWPFVAMNSAGFQSLTRYQTERSICLGLRMAGKEGGDSADVGAEGGEEAMLFHGAIS
jgi:hypothetical protein